VKTKIRKLRERALVELGRGAPVAAELLELRATPGGAKLSEAERAELLAAAVARQEVSLIVELRAYEQGRRDKGDVVKNRKGVRVRNGAMSRLGASARGVPYMRDHRQLDSTAKGGSVLEAKTVKLTEDGHFEVLATVQLVEPSAVERALRGLMSAVSVGLEALGPVNCTACKAEIFTRCYHLPFDVVKMGDGTEHEVEWEYEAAGIVEISEVPIGAVHRAGVTEIRAALSAVFDEEDATATATPEEQITMPPELLKLLGLSATATPEEILAAVQKLNAAAAADKAAFAIVQGDLAGFKTQLDALQGDLNKRTEDTFIGDALATGRIGKGDEEHWRALHQADAKRAGELMAKRAAGSATPVGAPPQRGTGEPRITGGNQPRAKAAELAAKSPRWAALFGYVGEHAVPATTLSATTIQNAGDLDEAKTGFHAAFLQQLELKTDDPIGMLYTEVPSTKKLETHNWFGDLPGFEKWDADRKMSGLEAFKLTIENEKWANGLRIKNDDVKDDALGLLPPQVQGLAMKARRHRFDLMIKLLLNGFDGNAYPEVGNGLAYDGAFFFADAHRGGNDNKMTAALDAAGLAAAELLLGSMTTYDGNDPLDVYGTHLVVGPKLRVTAEKLLQQERLANGEDNINKGKYKLIVSNRIRGTYDDYWFLADLSSPIKPLLFQMREEISTSAIIGQENNNSVPSFMNDELWFGAQARYNAAYFEFRTIVGSAV
jgi:phage major head subunit gpT-like protein